MIVTHIGVVTANYVAAETGYSLRPWDWGRAERATVEAFHGPNFAQKFDALIGRLVGLGFRDIELWQAHLDPHRATPSMIDEANAILEQHGARIIAYTAGLRQPNMARQEAERVYRVADAIGASLLTTGLHPSNAALARDLGATFGVRYAIENHPETSPDQMTAQIEAHAPWVGTVVDTGWWATRGVDPVAAIHALRDYLLHVHLKDVTRAGLPHQTCPLGDGIVDCPAVIRALQATGYRGHVAVEHEPENHDPTDDLAESLRRLRRWVGEEP
jgi:L-ribulose-5-phosphate 3-epimerase